jgi:uncharacterized membrane protein
VTYGLYVLIGLCWLPVLWLQARMTALAMSGRPLGPDYRRTFRLWFLLGWPAFLGVIAIYWLMVAKPAFHLALAHGSS